MVKATPADLHDAAAAKAVLFRPWLMYPEIMIVWTDSAYAGQTHRLGKAAPQPDDQAR
jgi:hypothetical protein